MIQLPPIPQGSLLGLNYSGMHDSAIAIVAPDGDLVFACALERLSRTKQDGRWPSVLLDLVPWDKIAAVAISTEETLDRSAPRASKLHPNVLHDIRIEMANEHGPAFHAFIRKLPVPVHFVCHHMCHASVAFWPSGFSSALCLTYDGGMSNCAHFGGLYSASEKDGIKPLDMFSTAANARISVLYSFVTAMLGFTPNKHEGKITGLAAYGKDTPECRALLEGWLGPNYNEIESLCDWYFVYDNERAPALAVNTARRARLEERLKDVSREDLAATVQTMAEEHVLKIIDDAKARGWTHDNICLSGGLFSNVKLNQRVKARGFKGIFVSPPMTDDGTAYGAALYVLSQQGKLKSHEQKTMAVGPGFSEAEIVASMKAEKLHYESLAGRDAAETIADLLTQGQTVALFSGRMEFGPRALGNRSILAAATDASINRSLNARLNRTEFMPFAPMTCYEDADSCYTDLEGAKLTAEFMTITTDCTPMMRERCPAVVHIDGTARPQLVRKDKLPLVHAIISRYKAKTGNPSIVNTSFNIHEEPIVCTPEDAIEGFLGSGLDYLFFDVGPGYLLRFEDNKDAALDLLQRSRKEKSQKEQFLSALTDELFRRHEDLAQGLVYLQTHTLAYLPVRIVGFLRRSLKKLRVKIGG